jgi:heme-degrading monooxygenase HmoA
MVCALTVRKLKPGTFEEFREAFMAPFEGGEPPEGWVRFNMVRSTEDPDEVICFGVFDGSADDVRRASSESDRDRQQEAIAPFVESVGADALYEVVEDRTP